MTPERTNIRAKLVIRIMSACTIVLLLTGAVLIVYDVISFRGSLVRMLGTRAEILAANSTAALAFENPEDAQQILAAIRTDPSMIAAAVYDRRGRRFGAYPADLSTSALPLPPFRHGHRFDRSSLLVARPVVEGGRWLGTLVLQSDLRAIGTRVRVYALVVLVAVLGSIGVAYALSSWLQRGITAPIRGLADTARQVSEAKDFSIRASIASDDEIGQLAETFNGMLHEIQQRDVAVRTSEARMRAILESALDCIITMNDQGRIVEFNPAAEKLFGYTRENVVGEPLADLLIPPALRERHRQGLARFLATGRATVLDRRLELSALTAEGREISVEIAITRIDQDGAPMFTGFIRDITERKRAEHEIQQLNVDLERRVVERTAELEASNRELEAFTYSVSHDLRAPLRHIAGFADLLQSRIASSLDDVARRHLSHVVESANRMGQLIDDLLVFSRMGRSEMQSTRVRLDQMVTEVIRDLEDETQDRKVEWSIGAMPEVQADPAMLRLVLTNLVSNALKYSRPRPEARIEITAERAESETVVSVHDNGVGFEMEYAPKLFGVFQRLHRADEFEGTGIGLANVRRIVQRHGGRTWAEGRVDHGATFHFSLPDMREAA